MIKRFLQSVATIAVLVWIRSEINRYLRILRRKWAKR
jgi:hypothetical protein